MWKSTCDRMIAGDVATSHALTRTDVRITFSQGLVLPGEIDGHNANYATATVLHSLHSQRPG